MIHKLLDRVRLPKPPLVAGTILLAAVVSVVRVRYPLDTWVPLFGFIQAEPARLAQYVTFFFGGILAYRNGWRLSRRAGYAWLAVGVALSASLFVWGLSWPGPWWTLLETVLCVGLSAGLLTLFRDVANRASLPLASASYAIYIIHLPIVVALQFAVAPLGLNALASFALVGAAGLALSIPAALLLRRPLRLL